MAKTSPYESGELTDSIFLILLTMLKPIYGYRIMQRIKEMTDNSVVIGPATMYTTLKKMKSVEWICEISAEGENGESGKILYQITPKGREVLLGDYRKKRRIVDIAEEELKGNYE